MPSAKHIQGTVLKGGTAIFLARLVNNSGALLTQSTLSSGAYTISRLDPNDPDSETAVTGHSAASLTIASVIYDTLQLDELWKNDEGDYIDTIGYNFKHQPDISTNGAFAVAGARYKINYRLTPSSGQVIVVAFEVGCI